MLLILTILIAGCRKKTPIASLKPSLHLLTNLTPVLLSFKLVLSGKYRFNKLAFSTIVKGIIKAAESLDADKLEQIVAGASVLEGAGKRVDALLKSKGAVSKLLFCEIKTDTTALLEPYPRSAVFVPAEDLRGAVAQLQKTIHKVVLRTTENYKRIADKEGTPTGEEVALVQPKGVVVIGCLRQFEEEHGINYEQFSSFELYRQQLHGIDILTFDELLARAQSIVE